MFGVRTAPHGPGDVTPVGMAANMALNVSSPAFGVAKGRDLSRRDARGLPRRPRADRRPPARPRCPRPGVDFDEAAARKHPVGAPLEHDRWALLRATDGSAHRA